MQALDPILNSRTLSRWILGLLLLAGLIVWVQLAVGWPRLLAPWLSFPPDTLILLFSLTALSYLFRAIRIYDYSLELLRGRFPATLRLSIIHNTLNNFLPMRLGELAYPLLMRRYFGQSLTAGGVSLLWIRLLDLHFLGLIGLGFLYLANEHPVWLWIMPLWLGLLPALYWGHGLLVRHIQGQGGKFARQMRKVLGHVPDQGRRFLRIWLWTALSWVFKFIAYTAVVLYFVDIPQWQAVFGVIGAELSSVLPIHGVAGSGSYELAMAAVLIPLGLDMQTVLQAAVNLHLYLLGANLLLALGALLLPKARDSRL